ncbi:MAG: hypothetical protein WKF47_00365 [Geodermatophilaceae bacterium]
MSVEEQLRSYLAEQARTVPPIDTHLFERALLRHRARRRQMTAMGVATVSAVAILVVAALALPVTWGDDTPVQQTTGPIDTAPPRIWCGPISRRWREPRTPTRTTRSPWRLELRRRWSSVASPASSRARGLRPSMVSSLWMN